MRTRRGELHGCVRARQAVQVVVVECRTGSPREGDTQTPKARERLRCATHAACVHTQMHGIASGLQGGSGASSVLTPTSAHCAGGELAMQGGRDHCPRLREAHNPHAQTGACSGGNTEGEELLRGHLLRT